MKFLAENWFFILIVIAFFFMMSGHGGGCGMHGGHGSHEHKTGEDTEPRSEEQSYGHHH